MNASNLDTLALTSLRAAYVGEQNATVAAGWTAAQFRAVVDSLVTERTPEGWTVAARQANIALRAVNLTGVVPAALAGVKLVRFDLFRRSYNRDNAKLYSEKNKRQQSMYAPAGSSLATVLVANKFAGLTQSNVYEVQGDRGIWKHYRGRALDASCEGTERACFLTWEEMEAIELAGGEPFADVEDPTV